MSGPQRPQYGEIIKSLILQRRVIHIYKILQTEFFPQVTKSLFKKNKPVNHELTNSILEKIFLKYGMMKIKVVIGMKLFKRRHSDIKSIIEQSTHFRYR